MKEVLFFKLTVIYCHSSMYLMHLTNAQIELLAMRLNALKT